MTTRLYHLSNVMLKTRAFSCFEHRPISIFKRRSILPRMGLLYFVMALGSLTCQDLFAQAYDNLNQLQGYGTRVYFSSGAEAKAKRMAEQIDRVTAFYYKQIHFAPSVSLLILSPQDWNTYTRFPVYGMPHYASNQTLVVASEDNDFWRSFVPSPDKVPKEYAGLLSGAYPGKNGGLTMEPFFDLLAIHELGHAYHVQDSLVMQRKWMGELFSNMFLHSYVAENEPALLPALTIFPKMVVATTDRSVLKYTTLEELESRYNEIGQTYPQNYGWYQCRWHMAAGDIYDKGGLAVFKNLWLTLKSQRVVLDDSSFDALLTTQVHQSVADVKLKWDN